MYFYPKCRSFETEILHFDCTVPVLSIIVSVCGINIVINSQIDFYIAVRSQNDNNHIKQYLDMHVT